jgi:flagellar biosynthesis/type III secretory pathway M-ring protein FliF/YscJ
MIALLATFASIPKPVKIALAAIAGALALWGMAALYINHRENAAVRADREQAAAEAATKALDAERGANRKDEAIQAANQDDDDETREAITDATAENPEAAGAPAGPVTRTVIDRLRERAARDRDSAD